MNALDYIAFLEPIGEDGGRCDKILKERTGIWTWASRTTAGATRSPGTTSWLDLVGNTLLAFAIWSWRSGVRRKRLD
jgi:hypothetical protein